VPRAPLLLPDPVPPAGAIPAPLHCGPLPAPLGTPGARQLGPNTVSLPKYEAIGL